MDEELTFKEYIKLISKKKKTKSTELMCKLNQFFPLDVMRNLYLALIQPYFTYCILAWGAVYKMTLHPLMPKEIGQNFNK